MQRARWQPALSTAFPGAHGGIASSSLRKIILSVRSIPEHPGPLSESGQRLATEPRQFRTPLVDAICGRGEAFEEAPFHVPGHKRGAGAPEGLARLVRPSRGSVLQYDLTEIAGLDFLSSPSGPILEAQRLAAEAFGAEHTWFLVNGCSVGIHAAVMAVTGETTAATATATVTAAAATEVSATAAAMKEEGARGQRGDAGRGTLIVARNCHLSAFSAMVLAGCEPYWVHPELDPRVGLAHCVTRGSVRAALQDAQAQGRHVVGVLIVSPTYFGAVADVEGIATECHAHDVPLLVDEAHGGHFAFLPRPEAEEEGLTSPPPPPPPPSALSCGADLVMQSTHKVLGALTQAAMLHAGGPRVCRTRINRWLQTLQSSSPSYLLMASLDAARAQAAAGGAFEEPSEAAQIIRAAVSRCKRIELLDQCTAGSSTSVKVFDPLRLTLLVDRVGLPGGGFGAAEWLERRHGVIPEMATAKTVVLALGPGTTRRHAELAAAAILELERAAPELTLGGVAAAPQPPIVQTSEPVDVVLSPRASYFAPVVSVIADEAVGRVSGELLCPYPPGVPLLFPGERITAASLRTLRATLAAGGAVTGASDSRLETLVVVAATATAARSA